MFMGVGHVGRQMLGAKIGGAIVNASPTLDLDFTTGTLDARITFTRGSTATYFDATGTMQTVSGNTPRFDYDPVTHAALGLLIEEARTNSLLNSRDLSSTWPSAGYTTVVNAAVAPDGTITAKQFTEDSSNGLHYSGPGATLAATTSYTFSIYIKAAGSRYVQLDLDNGGSDGACVTFDLQTGVISGPLTGRGSAVIGTAAMQTVGNGFYRCFMTTTAGAGGAGRVLVLGSNVPSPGFAPGYVGNTANSMFLWGAQLEQAAFPTSYIPTTGAAVTRAIEAARVAIASVGFDTTKGTLSYDYILEGATIGYGSPVGFVGSNEENDNILPDRRNAGGSPTAPTIQTAIINAAGATVGYAAAGSPPVVTAGAVHKGAIAWQINAPVHAAHDGVLWTPTQTPTSLPVITSLLIGGSPPSQPMTNQWARRVRYWPRILSDAELQSVTT